MVSSEKRKLFRPSSAPGKELCGHYEPTISTSPNAERGTGVHAEIVEKVPGLFRDEKARVFIDGQPSYIRYAVKVLLESGLKSISETEQLVELHDNEGDFVTEGTVDLYGLNESLDLMVYDWKTGQERDYSAQVVLYTLGLMQRDNFSKAWVHEVFVDQERTYRTEITRELAEERVFRIVDSVRNPGEHKINRFCDYCDLLRDCPAWAWERVKLGAFMPGKASGDIAQRLEYLKTNPDDMAQFIVIWKRFEKWVEKTGIKTFALDQMKQGVQLPGLKLAISSVGTQYIKLE